MTYHSRSSMAIYGLFLLSHFFVLAEEIHSVDDLRLDIKADHGIANIQTEMSRLKGNVELKHLGISIMGDLAEILPATATSPKSFVISGEPVKFIRLSNQGEITVKAKKIVYIPSEERMNFEEEVSLVQLNTMTQFEISANRLQMIFQDGQPKQLSAQGDPVNFSQHISERTIQITAKKLLWESNTQTVILHQATVIDQQTMFTADEIKYNTQTGEISAFGKGNNRPSYRYQPIKKEKAGETNDS